MNGSAIQTRASRAAVTALVAGGLLCTTAHVAAATPQPRVAAAASAAASAFTAEQAQLVAGLELIERMPESVIRSGHAAMASWLAADGVSTSTSKYGIVGCVAAVGLALLTNFTPAKILKIKAALKAVGGARTFVTKLKPFYDAARRAGLSKSASLRQAVSRAASVAGPEARAALLDLFGVTAVIAACADI